MVEVTQDNMDAFTLLTNKITDGDLDIVVSDISGSGAWAVRCADGACLKTFLALYEEYAKTLAGVNTSDEIVTESAVGDPLLVAVYNLFFFHLSFPSVLRIAVVEAGSIELINS